MKNFKIIIFFGFIGHLSLNSCQTNGTFETNDRIAEIAINIAYLENPNARYKMDYGQVKVLDSLPFKNGNQFINIKSFFIKENNLNQSFMIWRLGENNQPILESIIPVNLLKKRKLQFMQFSDNSNLTLFEPINPPLDKPTQINAQFFYADNNQPDKISITILAVDSFALLLALGQNPNNVAYNKKQEIKTFDIDKGKLSEIVTLDLNLFQQINGLETIFLYKITDLATGQILQNYGSNNATTINSKINIQVKDIRINPKNKFSLFQLKFNSVIVPFKNNVLVNGDEWAD